MGSGWTKRDVVLELGGVLNALDAKGTSPISLSPIRLGINLA